MLVTNKWGPPGLKINVSQNSEMQKCLVKDTAPPTVLSSLFLLFWSSVLMNYNEGRLLTLLNCCSTLLQHLHANDTPNERRTKSAHCRRYTCVAITTEPHSSKENLSEHNRAGLRKPTGHWHCPSSRATSLLINWNSGVVKVLFCEIGVDATND